MVLPPFKSTIVGMSVHDKPFETTKPGLFSIFFLRDAPGQGPMAINVCCIGNHVTAIGLPPRSLSLAPPLLHGATTLLLRFNWSRMPSEVRGLEY